MEQKTENNEPNAQSEKIVVGDKEFASVEELKNAYINASKVIGEQGRKMGEVKKGFIKEAAVDETDYQKLSDEFYENPANVFKKIEEKVEKRIKEKAASENQEKQVWDDFFATNKELAPIADKVKFDTYNRLWPTIKDLDGTQQFEAIAKEWNPLLSAKAPVAEEKTPVEEKAETDSYSDVNPSSAFGRTTQEPTFSKESSTTDAPTSLSGMLNKRFVS